MTEHPILFYFANTDVSTHPLVLVIGREPNTALPIVNTAGPYNYRDYQSTFWNMAYGTVARSAGSKAYLLKNECDAKRSSPILFANALPIGLEMNIPGSIKQAKRAKVSSRDAEEHIHHVFSFDSLIKRVHVVIASGHDKPEFLRSKDVIQTECKTRGVQLYEIPFFVQGTSNLKIDLALGTGKSQIAQVVGQFMR